MNLTITGHHVEVTPAIHDYVTSKIERVISHFDHVTRVAVILSVEKNIQTAEVTVHVRGKDVFVEEKAADLYAAIDGLVDMLDRQLQKHKEKISDHSGQGMKRQMIE